MAKYYEQSDFVDTLHDTTFQKKTLEIIDKITDAIGEGGSSASPESISFEGDNIKLSMSDGTSIQAQVPIANDSKNGFLSSEDYKLLKKGSGDTITDIQSFQNSSDITYTINTDKGSHDLIIPFANNPNYNYGLMSKRDKQKLDRLRDVGGITQESDPTVPQHVKQIKRENIDAWNLAVIGASNALSNDYGLGIEFSKSSVDERGETVSTKAFDVQIPLVSEYTNGVIKKGDFVFLNGLKENAKNKVINQGGTVKTSLGRVKGSCIFQVYLVSGNSYQSIIIAATESGGAFVPFTYETLSNIKHGDVNLELFHGRYNEIVARFSNNSGNDNCFIIVNRLSLDGFLIDFDLAHDDSSLTKIDTSFFKLENSGDTINLLKDGRTLSSIQIASGSSNNSSNLRWKSYYEFNV